MAAIHVEHRPATTVVPIPGASTLPAPAVEQLPVHVVPIRSVIFVILAAICGGLDIAGLTTSLVTMKTNGVTSDTSVWRTCTNTTLGGTSQVGCAYVDDVTDGCTLDSFRAMRAFAILAIVMALLVCVPLGVADILGVIPRSATASHADPNAQIVAGTDFAREALAAAAVVLMVCQLIFWAIFAGLWTQGCGGRTAFRDFAGSAYGPSAPLFIVTWILSLAMIAVPLALTRRQSKAVHSTTTTQTVLAVPGTVGAPFGHMPATAVASAGRHDIPVHALVYTLLAVLCGGLAIAGLTTNALMVANDRRTEETTVWRNCTTVNPPGAVSGSCVDVVESTYGCTLDSFRAMRAVGLLSVIFALMICLPLGIADIIGALPLNGARDLLGGAAILLMCFQLIFWAIFAGLWNQGCNHGTPLKDEAGSKYGPAAPLFIAAWVLSLAMVALPLALGRPHEKRAEAGTGVAPSITAPGPTVAVNDPMTH